MNEHVFVNCPFDEEYQACFEAILFTLTAAGYSARSALEQDDSADNRADKLYRLIEACDTTLHDLSRVEMSTSGLPRFNMPLELGIALGARRFGSAKQREMRLLIMVSKPFEMQKYMSDLAGNDPRSHAAKPSNIIRIVRDFLHTDPNGIMLSGATHLDDLFRDFKRILPDLAKRANLTLKEVDPLQSFRSFMHVLRAYVASKSIVPPPSGKRARLSRRK